MLWLTGDTDADALLSSEPLALLIGMVLDQQIPMERAFKAPYELKERLGGTLDPAAIATMPPDDLAAVFAAKPALHRFPRSMAGRVQEVCAAVVGSYDGDTAAIWSTATDGKELLANVKALPGFGDQKARIFVALLGKQFGVRPPGWEKAAGVYGEAGSTRSVADIDSPEALAKVRQFKQAMKAEARAKLPPPGVTSIDSRTGIDRWGLAGRRLYLCTPDRADLETFVGRCISGGVDVVQLREKHLDEAALVRRAVIVQRVCAAEGVPFVLNDRPDLAAAIGADGVHVGQDDESAVTARAVVGADVIVGLSTHASGELDVALGTVPDRTPADASPNRSAGTPIEAPAPVDYLSAGPVVPTPTKPGRPGTGTGYLTEATSRSPWPVWVTGGVGPDSVEKLVDAGARHFVVVRWLVDADDPAGAARELRTAIDRALDGAAG